MRALVTGAAGFIGSRTCVRLVAEGFDVVGLDDLSDGSLANLSDAPQVDLVQGDLREERSVRSVTTGCDVVFHLGALRSVPRSMDHPGYVTDVNVRGTMNVLSAANEEGARVVSASSSSVYGDQDVFPLHEGMEPRPRSPYAASKLAGEVYAAAWWRAFGTRSVSLRYFNVYGPHQDPANAYAAVIPLFLAACVNGERPVIHGDGHQARDFTYIDDVVEANLLASRADDRCWGRAINIGGGGSPTSVNQVLEIITELTGANPEPIREPPRPGDVRLTQADGSLAAEALGYSPTVGIREGLDRTVDWFRRDRAEHGDG